MGIIITGMKYPITTHSGRTTADTCILGRGELETRFDLSDRPRDIFVQLATDYALVGRADIMNVDINPLAISRRSLLCCNPSVGFARGLYIEGSNHPKEFKRKCFDDIKPQLACYMTEVDIESRTTALIEAFSKSPGLIKLLVDSFNPEWLHYGV